MIRCSDCSFPLCLCSGLGALLEALNLVDASPQTVAKRGKQIWQSVQDMPQINERLAKLDYKVQEQKETMEEQAKTMEEQAKKIAELTLLQRYSTKDQHEVGKTVLDDTAKGEREPLVLVSSVRYEISLQSSILDVDSLDTHEDQVINKPMFRLLEFLLEEYDVKAINCTVSSNFVDARGREHRGDQVLVSWRDLKEGSTATWPMVVTFFEGKLDLGTYKLCEAVGQCQRRGLAILEQQPWRKYVIVIFHCLDQIGFLKVSRPGTPSVSSVMPFLQKNATATLVNGQGFDILMSLLDSDGFGFIPCPFSLNLLSAAQLNGYTSAAVVCGRSTGKTVFRVQESSGRSMILKAVSDAARITREHTILQCLKGISGILSVSELFSVEVNDGVEIKQETAMLMESCNTMTPSTATPALFYQFSQILLAAAEQNVHHNDISLDNLLYKEGDGTVTGVIIDWEHATIDQHSVKGFQGKVLFAPDHAESNRMWDASLLGDLESLFYVAVSCCVEDKLEWPRLTEIGNMRRKRQEECCLNQLRRGSEGFLGKATEERKALWGKYLEGIRCKMIIARRNLTPQSQSELISAWAEAECADPCGREGD